MIDRRTLFRSAGAAAGLFVAGSSAPATATTGSALLGVMPGVGGGAGGPRAEGMPGRFDRPYRDFAPAGMTLRAGAPADVGLDPGPIGWAGDLVRAYVTPDSSGHPLYSGAVLRYVHNGVIVGKHVAGMALRYANQQGDELPANEQIPMRDNTIFDVASLSKLFTSIVVLQLAEDGKLAIEAPAAQYLPEFGVNGKAEITVKQLLTHTSGLQPDLPNLWQDYPDIPSRRKAILDVAPQEKPGTAYIYSDLNMLTLQFLAEKITGSTLDVLVRDGITTPLKLADTGYNPPASKKRRIAATEYQEKPARGLVWGVVHDEKAWSLGGVAGHAGVFSTAPDLAVLGQCILNGGAYRGARILAQATVEQMLTNYNQAFPDDSHGLGFELNQMWYMGALAGPRTAGHTGFTGTSLVIDPLSRSIVVLLTNRVHPSREWGSVNVVREAVARELATAMAVRPVAGAKDWYAAGDNETDATLTTPMLSFGRGEAPLTFRAFVDTEPTDVLVTEVSYNGGAWQPVRLTATGPGAPDGETNKLSGNGHRAWWTLTGTLSLFTPPPNTCQLRWSYRGDPEYRGRGVLIDGVLLYGEPVDGDESGEFTANGWLPTDR